MGHYLISFLEWSPSHYGNGPTRVAALEEGGGTHLKSLHLGGWARGMESYRPAWAIRQDCLKSKKYMHAHTHTHTTAGFLTCSIR